MGTTMSGKFQPQSALAGFRKKEGIGEALGKLGKYGGKRGDGMAGERAGNGSGSKGMCAFVPAMGGWPSTLESAETPERAFRLLTTRPPT